MSDLSPTDHYREPTRVNIDPIPLAVLRHDAVTLAEIEELFDADYAMLNAAAATGRLELAGPPLAVYHGDPRDRFDVEIGVPVAAALAGPMDGTAATISGSTLPGGIAVALTHVGSYNGLGACWNALSRAAEDEPTGDWAEVYVTEPGLVPVEQVRTDCLLYVRD